MTTTQQVIEIFAKLKVEMNGAVTQAMQERGVSYGLNYGVSAITIKRAVQDYAPDHTLALALWQQQIREMRLAAIFVDNPSEVTATQMEQWIDQAKTVELTQQCASQLFWKSVDSTAIIEQWITDRNDPLQTMAAMFMAGRLAHNASLEIALATRIVEYPIDLTAPLHLIEAMRYALREIYTLHQTLQPKIRQIPDPELQNQLQYI